MLIYICSDTLIEMKPGQTAPSHTHSFDAGAAWASMALQATMLGYHAHGMAGVEWDRVRAELKVPERFRVDAACVIGRTGPLDVLDEKIRAREVPSDRKPVDRVRLRRGLSGPKRLIATCLRAAFGPTSRRWAGIAVETGSGRGRMVTLPARPEPIRVSVEETAIVVIDMQNAYASKGGYVDLAGFDIAGAAGTIGQIAKVLETGARGGRARSSICRTAGTRTMSRRAGRARPTGTSRTR